MKSVYRHPHVRSAWQRDFLRWFRAHQRSFGMTVEVSDRSDHVLKLQFSGLPRQARQALCVSIRKNQISVEVDLNGHVCDLLLDIHVIPRRMPNGPYINSWELPKNRREYDTLLDLRHALLYQPFVEWVNESLKSARWLGVYSEADEEGRIGTSYARLLCESSQMDIRTHPEQALLGDLVRGVGQTSKQIGVEQWRQTIMPLAVCPLPHDDVYEALLAQVGRRYSSMEGPVFPVRWIQRIMNVGYHRACALKQRLMVENVVEDRTILITSCS